MQKMQDTWVPSLDREDPLEKEMATHSNTLAWRIPWTEDPGGLQSLGSDTTEQICMLVLPLCRPVQACLFLLQRANSMARLTPQETMEEEKPAKEGSEIKAGAASWEGGA